MSSRRAPSVILLAHSRNAVSEFFISSRIHQTATTGAIDAGTRWHGRLGAMPYTLAASVHNMGGGLEFNAGTDPLPLQFRFGAVLHPADAWSVTAGVMAPKGNRPHAAAGVEYRIDLEPIIPRAVLRMGFNNRSNKADVAGFSMMSVGAGLGFKRTAVDYAWVPFGRLGNAHRFTFSIRL